MKVQGGSLELKRTEYMPQAPEPQSLGRKPQQASLDAAALEQHWKEAAKPEELDELEVQEAVEALNDAIEYINRALRFSVHEDTQRMMVKVVNLENNEVIKEIPPEEVLDTVARIREMIGLLIDKWA